MEEENVAEEIAQEEVPQEVVQPQEEVSSDQSDKEYNFKALREGKKQLEDEVARLRSQVEQIAAPREEEIGDDDLVEGRHYKRLQQEMRAYIDQKEEETIPDRLRSRFSDFDSVVTAENVERLKQQEPELYQTITTGKNLYSKGVAAYKTLKSVGLGNSYEEEKKRVAHKAATPKSSSQTGSSALHDAGMFANGLTPELRKQLLSEMNQAARAR